MSALSLKHLKHMTVRRVGALVFTVFWLLTFLVFFLPTAINLPPTHWATWAVVVAGAYSAYASAVVLVEIMRATVPHFEIHSDDTHFRMVMITSVFLFILAALAYWLVLAAYR